LTAALGFEHAHIVKSIAGTGTCENILEDVRYAVGAEKTEGDADKDEPPPLGFVAERGDAKEKHQHDSPAPVLAERPEKPVEESAMVLVDPIKNIGF
jgi:hypothetical protein